MPEPRVSLGTNWRMRRRAIIHTAYGVHGVGTSNWGTTWTGGKVICYIGHECPWLHPTLPLLVFPFSSSFSRRRKDGAVAEEEKSFLVCDDMWCNSGVVVFIRPRCCFRMTRAASGAGRVDGCTGDHLLLPTNGTALLCSSLQEDGGDAAHHGCSTPSCHDVIAGRQARLAKHEA